MTPTTTYILTISTKYCSYLFLLFFSFHFLLLVKYIILYFLVVFVRVYF